MALLRDESGVDFLRKGAYPKAAERACEAMLRYLRAQSDLKRAEIERAALGERDHGGRHAYSLLHEYAVSAALSTHPMEFDELARLNWSHERPRLDVEISMGAGRSSCVSVVVTPAMETVKYRVSGSGWWTMNQALSTDFQVFRGGRFDLELGRLSVMEIYVDNSVIMDMFDRHAGQPDAIGDRLRAAREVVFHATQHKLNQLSMHFNCRVNTRLVMFGPNRSLETRQGTVEQWTQQRAGGDAGRAKEASVLDASGWNGATIQDFVDKHPWCSSWIRGFIEQRRASRSVETLREELADYMELPRHQVATPLVEALVAATDRQLFADEAMRRLEDVGILKAFIDEGGWRGYWRHGYESWVDRAASATGRDKLALFAWLLAAHPKFMREDGVAAMSAQSVFALARDLEAPWRKEAIVLPTRSRATLDRMLAISALGHVPKHSRKEAGEAQKPLSKSNQQTLWRLAGHSDWGGLIAWAGASWPELARELGQLKVDGKAQARAREQGPSSAGAEGQAK